MAGKVRVKEGDMNIEETIQEMEAASAMVYTAEYAQYVEFPTAYTGPKPPFQPLRDWVGRKWGDLDADFKTDQHGNALSKDAVAWKLQSIIYQNGTRAVYFGRRSLDTAANAAPAIAAQYEGSNDPQAPEKIVAEVAKVGFNKSQAIISQEATDTGNLLQSGSVELLDGPDDLPGGDAP